jgi:membrane protease YdiL (CAAX protease family)
MRENGMLSGAGTALASRPTTHISGALGLAIAIVVVEYIARHFALFWLPTLGALRVNDMLVAGICYLGLVAATVPPERRALGALAQNVRAIFDEARGLPVWLGALAAIGAGVLVLLDQLLWGGVALPSVHSPWRWDLVLLAPAAPVLVAASMLLVNGWVIPFAEEWLWRGNMLPKLSGAIGQIAGLLVTSLLFSLKHALVDASLGRLLALTAFGLVMSVLALRRGWRASALAHALANTLATILALASGQL